MSTLDALVLAMLGLFTLCVLLAVLGAVVAVLGAVVAGAWLVELVLSWLWS